MGGLLLGGRGRLTSPACRRKAIELIGEAKASGATLSAACGEIGISLRTLKRWRRAFLGDGDGEDRRKGSPRHVAHRLSEEERRRILLTCNQPEYASLPPGQIVPALADQDLFIGSESSFYRVLHQAGQCQRRGRARRPQEPRTVPRLRADRPNAVWSWDITYLPTTVRGVWLYLYLVIDVWSRKVVGWAMANHLRTQLVLDAFNMAVQQRQPRNVIHHSDQGCQYTSIAFGKRCRELGVRPSMGSAGDCYDNALCESFFATLECELIDRFTFRSNREARLLVFRWIEAWYNPHRKHSSIGRMSPVNFERRHHFIPPNESANLSTKPG